MKTNTQVVRFMLAASLLLLPLSLPLHAQSWVSWDIDSLTDAPHASGHTLFTIQGQADVDGDSVDAQLALVASQFYGVSQDPGYLPGSGSDPNLVNVRRISKPESPELQFNTQFQILTPGYEFDQFGLIFSQFSHGKLQVWVTGLDEITSFDPVSGASLPAYSFDGDGVYVEEAGEHSYFTALGNVGPEHSNISYDTHLAEGYGNFSDIFAVSVRTSTIPEPSSALLLSLAGVSLSLRRRRAC